jgi:hypothetical protein
MAPHPVRFVPGIRWQWGKFPIVDRTPPPDPKYPRSIIPHNSAYGKISHSPAGRPPRCDRRRCYPRLRVVRQAVAEGWGRSTAGNSRPRVLIRFRDRGLRPEAKPGFEHFEGLRQIGLALPTGHVQMPVRAHRSTAAGGQGLDTEGRRTL